MAESLAARHKGGGLVERGRQPWPAATGSRDPGARPPQVMVASQRPIRCAERPKGSTRRGAPACKTN